MKIVRIYELSVKEEAVPEDQTCIDRHYGDFERGFVSLEQDCTNKPVFQTTVERIPIQEFCEVKVPDHLKPRDPYRHYYDEREVDRTYIAIPEELEKLITTEWQEKVDYVRGKLDERMKDIQDLLAGRDNDRRKLQQWWSQPWYRRVWSALKA